MRTFTRLLKSFSARGQKKAAPRRHRLALEPLEDRLALANFTWTGCESSLWSDPRNWLELQAPTPIDLEGNRVLYFPETACSTSSTNDIGVVATSRIRIEGDGYNIGGGTVRLSHGPSDNALLVEGDQTFLGSNLELVSPDMLFEVRSIIRFTVAGAISGAGGFRKVGEGYLVLTEGNTYTGTTTVNRGRLEVSHPRALGDTAGSTIINDQGTLILKSDSSGGTESLTLHGLGASLDGALLAQGTLMWSGTIELGSEETAVSVGGATAELTLDGVIRNKTGRTGGLSKGGIGTLRLAGNQPNSYTGTTKVDTGKLILEKNPGVTAVKGPLVIGDNFGPARSDQVRVFYPDQISDTAAVTVNARGVFEVRGATGASTIETIGALTLNGGVVSLGTGLDTGILTLAGNVTATSVTLDGQNQPASIEGGYLELGAFTRTFTVNDGPGGTELTVLSQVSDGGLTKAGTGNMRLAAANTYSGFTAIDAGTLRIDGNQATSPVVVNTGGTVAGDGTVKVLTVNAGGTVRPLAGQSLTVGGTASFANANSSFSVELLASSVGQIGVVGALTLNNAALRLFDLNVPGHPEVLPPLGASILILGAASITGTFNGLPNNGIAVSVSGFSYRVNYLPNVVFITRVNGPMFPERAVTSPVDEGGVATLTGRIATVLPEDTFFLEVNWGDGSRTETFRFRPRDPREVAVSHRYRDNGSYAVEMLWRDERGSFNTGSLTVTVDNVVPSMNAGGDALVAAGGMFVRNGFFTDPGADSWTATVDYGDGNGAVPLALNPAQRFSLQHRYMTPGIYTVTVSVRDDDGGVGMTSFRVTVPSDLAVGSASDPVRREKIAAAKRGKLRPPEASEEMRAENLG